MSTNTWKGDARSLEYSSMTATLRRAASHPMSGSSSPTSVMTRTTRMRGSPTSSSILCTEPPVRTSLTVAQIPSIVFGRGYRSTLVLSDLLDIRFFFLPFQDDQMVRYDGRQRCMISGRVLMRPLLKPRVYEQVKASLVWLPRLPRLLVLPGLSPFTVLGGHPVLEIFESTVVVTKGPHTPSGFRPSTL